MLRVGLIEPHLQRVGGIRRMVELANRLVDRGHEVTFYLPADAELACTWLPFRARIAAIEGPVRDELDVVLFNHEPQWFLLALFERATARAFYALSYSHLYGKSGSWASLRADVDLRLANSSWTAELVERETDTRPAVLLCGISQEYFHPVEVEKRYPILCAGDPRPWKGTETIEAAAHLLGLPLERYGGKDLPQEAMAEEYCKAEVFVVGSPLEGFGQPGLEALACGVPLVTTDNGGCSEYAIHEETALVVPAGDAGAMAAAVERLRGEPELGARLRENGLELVAAKFDWERATDEFERHLLAAVATADGGTHTGSRPALTPRTVPERPALSVVATARGKVKHTQRFVESVRRHTDVPYELIFVDNGSEWEAAACVREAADVAIRNEANVGVAAALNQGLARARGEFVAFCHNDTILPPGWASPLIEHLRDDRIGIAVPSLTEGEPAGVIDRFGPTPPAAVYMLRTQTARALGGFDERYLPAFGEDVDLAFTVWVNGLEIVRDSRVLAQHAGNVTVRQLGDWQTLQRRNRERFVEKWTAAEPMAPRLEQCSHDAFAIQLASARSAARAMRAGLRTGSRLRERASRLGRRYRGAVGGTTT